MKNKSTFLGVALLVAVLMLGIGYAAATQTLKITGTATGVESAENFNVVFTSTAAGDAFGDNADGVTVEIDSTDTTNRTAVMTVELGKVGSVASASFEVANQSQAGIAAIINADNVRVTNAEGYDYTSDYFEVTTTWPEGTSNLAVGDTVSFEVNVKLKKAVIGDSQTEQFFVVIDGVTSAAE